MRTRLAVLRTVFVLLSLVVLSLIVLSGCAADMTESDDDLLEEVAETEEAVSGARTVTLKFEGTCDFLRSCSRWSRGLPEGTALWGCPSANRDHDGDGAKDYGSCSDDELWVAGPTRAYCGRTARICKGSVCVDAKVKDVSVTRDWEASTAVFDALGLKYGLKGRCSGFGSGRVTVSSR